MERLKEHRTIFLVLGLILLFDCFAFFWLVWDEITSFFPDVSYEVADLQIGPRGECSVPEVGDVRLAVAQGTAYPTLEGTPVPFSGQDIRTENAAQVVRLAHWGTGPINDVAWSPAGDLIAVASTYGVYLYDSRSLSLTLTLDHPSTVHQVVFNSDGSLLGSQSGDDTVRLWQTRDGKLLNLVETDGELRDDLGDDGELLILEQEESRLSSASHGQLVQQLRPPTNEYDYASIAAFSPDGTLVASIADSVDAPGIVIWRREDGSVVQKLTVRSPLLIYKVAFSPDGKLLALGGSSGDVQIWRLEDGRRLHRKQGRPWAIYELEWSTDGTLLLSGSQERLNVWNASSGALIQSFEGGIPAAFSPDGTSIAFGDLHHQLQARRMSDGVLLNASDRTSWIGQAALHPSGHILAVEHNFQEIQFRRLTDGVTVCTLVAQPEIEDLAWSPDGRTLAVTSGSADDLVRLWNTSTMSITQEWRDSSVAYDIEWSPDGQWLATGSHDERVRLWQASDGALLREFEGLPDGASDVAFSPDGSLLAAAGYGRVKVWRTVDSTLVREFGTGGAAVAFSPNGRLLGAASSRGIVVWRLEDGEQLYAVEGHTDVVKEVAFDPDGEWLISAAADQDMRIWQVADGTLLKVLSDHREQASIELHMVLGTGFIVSTSSDGTIGVWSIPNRE